MIDNTQDIIDVRDVIKEYETSEGFEDYRGQIARDVLKPLLDELRGKGGDYQWLGDWYPLTLIRDSHFQTYASDYAESIGAINAYVKWPNYCIDWECAASELQMDYTSVDFAGVTYWYN